MDSVVAEKIAMLSRDGSPKVIYVIKTGAHWPYAENYPAGLADLTLRKVPVSMPAAESDYLKAVTWNVDNFWKLLLPRVELRNDLLVIYTADHGEDYKLRSYQAKHASLYMPGLTEGQVPLIVLDRSGF